MKEDLFKKDLISSLMILELFLQIKPCMWDISAQDKLTGKEFIPIGLKKVDSKENGSTEKWWKAQSIILITIFKDNLLQILLKDKALLLFVNKTVLIQEIFTKVFMRIKTDISNQKSTIILGDLKRAKKMGLVVWYRNKDIYSQKVKDINLNNSFKAILAKMFIKGNKKYRNQLKRKKMTFNNNDPSIFLRILVVRKAIYHQWLKIWKDAAVFSKFCLYFFRAECRVNLSW